MGILDRFLRKKAHRRGPNLLEVLASVGCVVTPEDIATASDRVKKQNVNWSLKLPEELTASHTGELGCTGPDSYQVYVSMACAREDVAKMLAARTNLMLMINELCRAKGLSHMVLKPGKRVALCDPGLEIDGNHPLYALFQSALQ